MERPELALLGERIEAAKANLDRMSNLLEALANRFPKRLGRLVLKSPALKYLPIAGALIELSCDYLRDDFIKEAEALLDGLESVKRRQKEFDASLSQARASLAGPNGGRSTNEARWRCFDVKANLSAAHDGYVNELETVGSAANRFMDQHMKEVDKTRQIVDGFWNELKRGGVDKEYQALMVELSRMPAADDLRGGFSQFK
jgi:hypothetical protein